MRKFNAVLLLLLMALFATAQKKQYVSWGKYKWEVNWKFDTIQQSTTSKDNAQITEPGIIHTSLWFKKKQKLCFNVGRTVSDTISVLNSVTFEKEEHITTYSELDYDINAGKIKRYKFGKLLKKWIELPEISRTRRAINIYYSYSATDHRHFFLLREELFITFPYVKEGDYIIAEFRYGAEGTKEDKIIGRVLFEII